METPNCEKCNYPMWPCFRSIEGKADMFVGAWLCERCLHTAKPTGREFQLSLAQWEGDRAKALLDKRL